MATSSGDSAADIKNHYTSLFEAIRCVNDAEAALDLLEIRVPGLIFGVVQQLDERTFTRVESSQTILNESSSLSCEISRVSKSIGISNNHFCTCFAWTWESRTRDMRCTGCLEAQWPHERKAMIQVSLGN